MANVGIPNTPKFPNANEFSCRRKAKMQTKAWAIASLLYVLGYHSAAKMQIVQRPGSSTGGLSIVKQTAAERRAGTLRTRAPEQGLVRIFSFGLHEMTLSSSSFFVFRVL